MLHLCCWMYLHGRMHGGYIAPTRVFLFHRRPVRDVFASHLTARAQVSGLLQCYEREIYVSAGGPRRDDSVLRPWLVLAVPLLSVSARAVLFLVIFSFYF